MVMLLQSMHYAELVSCSFHDNLGTAVAVNNTNITLSGNTKFAHTRSCSNIAGGVGGAIMALNSKLAFTGNTTFLDNSDTSPRQCSLYSNATDVLGGAIYTLDNTVITFSGTNYFTMNTAASGGAIFASYNTALIFSGTNYFISNSAGAGGAIYTYGGTIHFSGTNYFINNSASEGGAYCTSAATVSFTGTNELISNIADVGYGGGAIFSSENNALIFNGTVKFTNNACRIGGGGLYMGLKSTFSILPNTSVYWENNHASLGGAIYVKDASPISYCTSVAQYVPKEECFFQLPDQNLSSGIDVQLVFTNNSADDAGSVLYGGAIDNGKLIEFNDLESHNSGEVFDMLVHKCDTNSTSNISSDPLQICPCENNLPDCGKWQSGYYNFPHTVHPGETFHVSVVAVGQRNGTVPSTVISSIDQHITLGDTLDPQYLQRKTDNTCTTLSYIISSLSLHVWLDLHAERNPCDVELQITVNLNQTCPPGFNISKSAKSCVCEPRLAQYTNNCTITNGVGQITRKSGQQFWVGCDNQLHGLILHSRCPFDDCVNHTVVFPLNNTDMQCAYNRSSLLCGACKKGYSLMLGISHCRQCTNSHLVLLIAFAVMGVALVFLLLVCKLTVATGTLSGLVFYANIVGVNRTTFLPVESNSLLSVFIAWLNLDWY